MRARCRLFQPRTAAATEAPTSPPYSKFFRHDLHPNLHVLGYLREGIDALQRSCVFETLTAILAVTYRKRVSPVQPKRMVEIRFTRSASMKRLRPNSRLADV